MLITFADASELLKKAFTVEKPGVRHFAGSSAVGCRHSCG
jgi:hypothetical protein